MSYIEGKWQYPKEQEESRIPAMSAATLSLGERISLEIHNQPFRSALIKSGKGIVYQSVLNDHFVIFIIWTNKLNISQLYESWDDLQYAIKLLRGAVGESR